MGDSYWTKFEIEDLKMLYSTTMLKANCTLEDAKDTSLPIDSYIVTYEVDDSTYYDIVLSQKRVSVFDMYYDKFGPGAVKSIQWTSGKISTKMWNAKK